VLRPLPYRPYEDLAGRPHVMVDGAARAGSVLTLSHWPQSPTPARLARDVSAEIVLAYLAGGEDLSPGAEAVTNDHFDEDGVMSVVALVDPQWALGRAELLVEVATCGDFGVVRSDEAAQISFTLVPLAEELAGRGATASEQYSAVLERIPGLVEHSERFEPYWRTDLAGLTAGRHALESGEVTLSERPELDLAIVERVNPAAERLVGAVGGVPIHEAVVNTATTATRLLAFDGDRCELVLRYEGWVRFVSRQVALRPDLGPLAEALTAFEPGRVTWEANPVGAIIGRLHPSGERCSQLGPERITAAVSDYLRTAPPVWDPFRPGSSHIPPAERERYPRGDDGAGSSGSRRRLRRGASRRP
jgi:hypothetical protein